MKKVVSLLLVLLLALSALCLTACNKKTDGDTDVNDNVETIESNDISDSLPVHVSQDKFRSYYHIWVCAFNDSNDDETGDLQGIIDKLDYINDGNPETDTDLGMDAIWLSPMMPSDSYHKYDVDDYMDVDPEFGDLETFDRLIEECDKRGIAVILDLVLNHCGTGHEFWQKAVEEAKEGNLDGYAKYYVMTDGVPGVEGWRQLSGTDIWYEGQFSPEMPEWNLEYEGTREYFEEVAKFWLERGVAGFRLDAVMYMTDDKTDGTEFLNWFYTTAQKYNPDVYMVGENWQGNSQIYNTYESGIDSQFAFPFATSSGNFAAAANSSAGKTLAGQLLKYDENCAKRNENTINAFFLSNHDMVRSANYFPSGLNYQKMAAALYLITPGNSFTYYGEELGALVPAGYNENDAFFRGAMNFDEENPSGIWCTAAAYQEWPYEGVKQQTDDKESLLSFYRQAIRVKNQNPQIARGDITAIYDFGLTTICAFKVVCSGEAFMVIHNLDDENACTLTITEDMLKDPSIGGKLYAMTQAQMEALTAEGEEVVTMSTLVDDVLRMPAQSTVVLVDTSNN